MDFRIMGLIPIPSSFTFQLGNLRKFTQLPELQLFTKRVNNNRHYSDMHRSQAENTQERGEKL